MRKFDTESAVSALELQQLVVDWCHDIDTNGGAGASAYFSEDCVGDSGVISFKGHAGLKKYYADRLAVIRATPEGIRTSRHGFSNLRISFENKDRATLNFLIFTFAANGPPPIADATVPVAVSDSRFECRREGDGHWRVFEFVGRPIFLGGDDFAKKALTGK